MEANNMQVNKFFIGVILQFFSLLSLATTPEFEIKRMVERDMVGDPSVRMSLAAPGASIMGSPSRQTDRWRIAFELDADEIELATAWRFDNRPHVCSIDECVIGVVYRVVGKTTGVGVPTWDRPLGREIQPLAKPIEYLVKYNLKKINGEWKLSKFPPPYVNPQALKDFFKDEMKKASLVGLPANADARAIRNQEIIKAWRQRQLKILRKLPR